MRTTTLDLPESRTRLDDRFPTSPTDSLHRQIKEENHAAFIPVSDEARVPALPLPPAMLEHREAFAAIITQSPGMRLLFQYLESIAPTPLPILITGETGVGKELVAEAIHHLSCRQGKLVTLNVAGVDDELFSDTLFGHKRGGFTGADRDRPGLIEQAAGGTLFLDEIGDLNLGSQVKLLRLLQEGKYYPIGADVVKLTDARFIVATNQDLDLMQQKGLFRKDLYYRLRAHNVHIPPLRERREDIPLLVDHFLKRASATLGKKKPTPPRELMPLLENLPFAGNIRELEGIILDLVSRHKSGMLSIQSIRSRMSRSDTPEILTEECPATLLFGDPLPTMKEAEQLLIEEALRRCRGIQTLAAQMLGMSRRGLSNRVGKMRRQDGRHKKHTHTTPDHLVAAPAHVSSPARVHVTELSKPPDPALVSVVPSSYQLTRED